MSIPASCWSVGQASAQKRLLELGDLFYFTDWRNLKLRPRIQPIICAESGAGKSHLIREGVARELGVSYLKLTGSSWIVLGAAKELVPTLERVKRFVEENDQGLIHIDESDKITQGIGIGASGGQNPWDRSVTLELLDLLDRSPGPVRGREWSPDLLKKLNHDFWFVSSGSWQPAWKEVTKAKVGFGSQDSPGSIAAQVKRIISTSDIVAPELLLRFNELLVVEPATANDFRESAKSFGLTALAGELSVQLDFDAAVKSGRGARWLEETCTLLLLEANRQNRIDLLPKRPFLDESFPEAQQPQSDIDESVF